MANENLKKSVSKSDPKDKANEAQKERPRKLGEGHVTGMARLGFHELTKALQAFPDSNITPMEEPGVFGNENAPQRVAAKQEPVTAKNAPAKNDTADKKEPPKEVTLKDILNAPPQTTPSKEPERDIGREM